MKVFRDPLYNIIDLNLKNKSQNEIVERLIDTKEIQRLKYIKQLGLAYFTFPGAQHTRFEHSLGTAYLSNTILDGLSNNIFDENTDKDVINNINCLLENRFLLVVSSLLHDVGHGPFSHNFEEVVGISHEEWTKHIICSDKSQINTVLEGYSPGLSSEVSATINKDDPGRSIISKLLSGQLDVDRIDYLLRDSLMTGAKYGNFDYIWLLNNIRFGIYNGEFTLGLDKSKGLSVAEDYIMARFYMFTNIYLHKTSRFAELLLNKILLRAKCCVLGQGDGSLEISETLRTILKLDATSHLDEYVESYLELTDIDILFHISRWRHCRDKILSDLSKMFMQRTLFKCIYVDERMVGNIDKVKQMIVSKNYNTEYYFFEEDIIFSHYLSPDRNTEIEKSGIVLFDNKGNPSELVEDSFVINAILQKAEKARDKRIYVPRELYEDTLKILRVY